MSNMELLYEGETYANAYTEVLVDDTDGPGGGRHVYDVGFQQGEGDESSVQRISFQCGPVVEAGINGIQDEGLMIVLIDRLQRFQAGPYSCRENALALTKLQEALHWMEARKRDRMKRGVEGRNKE